MSRYIVGLEFSNSNYNHKGNRTNAFFDPLNRFIVKPHLLSNPTCLRPYTAYYPSSKVTC